MASVGAVDRLEIELESSERIRHVTLGCGAQRADGRVGGERRVSLAGVMAVCGWTG